MRKAVARRLQTLSAIERQGTRTVRIFTLAIDRAAKAALRGGTFKLDDKALTQELVKLMVEGFARAYLQAQKERPLELSFTTDVRTLARRTDLDLADLRRSFTRDAGPRVRQTTRSIAERINRELGDITAEQLSTRDSIRELRQAIDRMGLSPHNAGTIETLVRSHAAVSMNAAQISVDRRQDRRGLIKGYLYSAVLDDRTTDECADRDGLIISADSPLFPPCHYNCRCQAIPVTDDVEISEIPASALAAIDEDWRFSPADLL